MQTFVDSANSYIYYFNMGYRDEAEQNRLIKLIFDENKDILLADTNISPANYNIVFRKYYLWILNEIVKMESIQDKKMNIHKFIDYFS